MVTVRPPRHRVGRRFVLWRTLQELIWALVVLGVLGGVYARFEAARPWVGPLLLVLGPIFLVTVTVMPTVRYRVHRWETTDDAVYALEGWLSRKWVIVPISRIQSIDLETGPLQQVLGLATVKVTTAAPEAHVTIEGLDRDAADEAVRHLKDVTAATPGDAT